MRTPTSRYPRGDLCQRPGSGPGACDHRFVEDPALAAELIARMSIDAEARGAAERAFAPDGICRNQAIAHRISEVDRDNTAWIRGVLEAGWPGWKRVGEEGAFAAWLLCQHADRQPAVCRSAPRTRSVGNTAVPPPARFISLEPVVRAQSGGPLSYGFLVLDSYGRSWTRRRPEWCRR